jgi:TetR/AcrR family transcriptional repressor of mexJK operon
MSARQPIRKPGRPTLETASQIGDRILDVAENAFLKQGYGDTSIAALSQELGIGNRTFYGRFANKEALFAAVVHRLIARMRPENMDALTAATSLEDILLNLAMILMEAALAPDALALYRMMMAESSRFPELAGIMEKEGARAEAVEYIAGILWADPRHKVPLEQARFAGQQFLHLVLAEPQRRALGLGAPMNKAERKRWATQAVTLFLRGIGGN